MPIGSDFDDFLKEQGIFETTTAIAIKRVLAFQIEQEIQAQRLPKATMTQRLHSKRASFNRLLNE